MEVVVDGREMLLMSVMANGVAHLEGSVRPIVGGEWEVSVVGVYGRGAGVVCSLSADVVEMVFMAAIAATVAISRADTLLVCTAEHIPMAGLAAPTTKGVFGALHTVVRHLGLAQLGVTFIGATNHVRGDGFG